MLLPQPIAHGTLIKRYKRFLADIELDTGEKLTAHCANPGSMAGLNLPGMKVWLSKSPNKKRKLPWSLEFVEVGSGLVGINTSYPNKLVAEALAKKHIASLAHYPNVRPEVKYGEKSRVDFLLTGDDLPDCYLEVKNVHFSRTTGLAEFPDSVTLRGARHLAEMSNMVAKGHRAVTLYVVQRTDCTNFSLAPDFDPNYATAFAKAKLNGVESLVYACQIAPEQISLGAPLPIVGSSR